ncbi:MAG: FAD-binding and (Fe-S)-binding domain-containing protein [candidate division WOR-3 bacterium]
MKALNKEQRAWLEERFGPRVSFSRRERSMYSHDIGSIPGLVRPFIGKTIPHAVVQPQSEDEIADIVRWARNEGIHLIPRGKSTSGYGGVIPVKGGIVLDLIRLQRIISIDGDLVTVEPGISWKKLDEAISDRGLTLRLYPSSYPSSTVGGWLAQGGAGFGSWRFGWFSENVVSARVVLPDGSVREFSGRELSVISDAEGTTGIITGVSLRVMPKKDLRVTALAFDSPTDAAAFVSSIGTDGIWSLSLVNPEMVRLWNIAPLRTHHGHPAEERVILPEKYMVILAHEKNDADFFEPVKKSRGQFLSPEIAKHEWDERFHLMKIKRLGPSFVPAEVVVPIQSIGDVLAELEKRLPFLAIDGMGVSGKEMVLLGFITHDERSFWFNTAYLSALTTVKIAERHGGRPYSTGIYFTRWARDVLGGDRLEELSAFKNKHDPHGIMNPGKVTGSRLSWFMGLAKTFEPIARPLAGIGRPSPAERIGLKPKKGIPPDVAWFAYSCSQCGFCVDTCDQFYGRLWESQSPRGKWFFLRQLLEGKEKFDQEAVNTFMVCTTCEYCNVMCSEGLPIEPSWLKLRGVAIEDRGMMTIPPFEIMAASLARNLNIWAHLREKRDEWVPEDVRPHIKDSSPVMYFAGCTASFVEKDMAQAAVRLLRDAGVEFTMLGKDESCCGLPMLVAGKWKEFADVVKHNISEARKRGVKTVITSCPACWLSWHTYYKEWAKKLGIEHDFEVKHYSEVLAPRARELGFREVKERVTFHDSCHIGRAGGVYEEPRELIKAVPGLDYQEMRHNREYGLCCGSVLTLISEPSVAAEVGKERLDEANEIKADRVLTLCPCCRFQLTVTKEKKGIPVEITDLATFLARAKGYDVKEDEDYLLSSWATFEAMIMLMKPHNMAALMTEMFPQMVDAMPFGMGRMMRFIGKLGPVGRGLLKAMKPLFPVLFPILLPMMMPKLTPTMIELMAKRVPMPEFMAEQMPDLVPKAMGNLMPHLLPDVVPLVSQPLIDYLTGRSLPSSSR